MIARLGAVASLLLGLCACAIFEPYDHFEIKPVPLSELSGWQNDKQQAALRSFIASCTVLQKKTTGQTTDSGLQISPELWQSLCVDAQHSTHNEYTAEAFFKRRFTPYRVSNGDNEIGLFTGYYEPLLHGALHKGGKFIYPVYGIPTDLKNHKPYYTRAQIDAGALKGKAKVLVWVDDPVMLFFLHIQGSGRVRLNHHKDIFLGYADQNGQPYTPLGKVMIDEGLIAREEVNFFTLRQYLYDHLEQATELMQHNPSYVFFRIQPKAGAIGAAGATLTPQRSLAVDKHHIPYGLPLFLQTELPPRFSDDETAFNHLIIAQDTGGAIKGPVRGDIFFGSGIEAEYYAGYMKGKGTYTLLVPKELESQLVSHE